MDYTEGGSYAEGVIGGYGEGFETATEKISQVDTQRARARPVGENGSSGEGFDETVVKETRVTTLGSATRPGGAETRTGSGGAGSGGGARAGERSPKPIKQPRTLQGAMMYEEGMVEEGVEETVVGYEEARAGEGKEAGEFGYATTTKTAKTEQLETSNMEERKTFTIRSVVDPSDESAEISLNDAIMHGIIKPEEGTYYDIQKDEAIPIPLAMSQGKIKVEFTSTRRSREKRSTIGIITVKTIKENIRPYRVLRVKDTGNDQWLPKEQAVRKNLLDEKHGVFISRKSGREMMIMTAVDRGLVEVEFIGEAEPPEVISQTYAVRAVVDTRYKRVITFADAVRRGIIDKESGAFKDTATGDTMYVGDAIMRGFLKARPVDDPTSLNIDPENKLLVDKTEQIRKKILKPLGVISAFKAAAKGSGK